MNKINKLFMGILLIGLSSNLLSMSSEDQLFNEFYKQRAKEYLEYIQVQDMDLSSLRMIKQAFQDDIARIEAFERGSISISDEERKKCFDINWERMLELQAEILYSDSQIPENEKRSISNFFFYYSKMIFDNALHLAHRRIGYYILADFEKSYEDILEQISEEEFIKRFNETANSVSLDEKQEIILKNCKDFTLALLDELEKSE